jgi:hypothetical protein
LFCGVLGSKQAPGKSSNFSDFRLTKGYSIYIVTVGVTKIAKTYEEIQTGRRVIPYPVMNYRNIL